MINTPIILFLLMVASDDVNEHFLRSWCYWSSSN